MDAFELGTGMTTVIIGTGGNAHQFKPFPQIEVEYQITQIQATIGFGEMVIK